MGYRSDVKLIISGTKEQIKYIGDKLISESTKEDYLECFNIYHDNNEYYYLTFNEEGCKGYPGQYTIVDEIEDIINNSDDDLYKGCHFIRIGEDVDDIEERYYGDVPYPIQVKRYSDFDFVDNDARKIEDIKKGM